MQQTFILLIGLVFSFYNTAKASSFSFYELTAALEKFEVKYNPSQPNDFSFRKSHINRLEFPISWAPVDESEFTPLENSYLITGQYREHFTTDMKCLSESLYKLNYQQFNSIINGKSLDLGAILLTQFFLNGWQSYHSNLYEQCAQEKTPQCYETVNNLIAISNTWKQYLNLGTSSAYNDYLEEISQSIDQWLGTEGYSVFRYLFPK